MSSNLWPFRAFLILERSKKIAGGVGLSRLTKADSGDGVHFFLDMGDVCLYSYSGTFSLQAVLS
jgi:hypothetical protein